MSHRPSTTTSGKAFAAATIEAVWEKAQVTHQHHPLRMDSFGALIWKEAYGNTSSKFGWEIDHIKSVAAGGGDELENLQPLQWENNRRKGDRVCRKLLLDSDSISHIKSGLTLPQPL